MQTYRCQCGRPLYFDNTFCTKCHRDVGWCEPCGAIVSLPQGKGVRHCPAGHAVLPCRNRRESKVCNRWVAAGSDDFAASGNKNAADPGDKTAIHSGSRVAGNNARPKLSLCRSCAMNGTIPDLTVLGNPERWARLEAAKRRMLYDLNTVGLSESWLAQQSMPLQFDFKTDAVKTNGRWHRLDDGEPIYTGHANGLITINLKEADPVERERSRVALGEPQRTLVGHFRHEVGHYIWDVLIRDHAENLAAFTPTFGDPYQPRYADALEQYYQAGPPADWGNLFVSAYAAMHPWEDWAETWSTYLSVMSTLEIVDQHAIFYTPPEKDSLGEVMDEYVNVSIALNEINRNRGLIAAFPEILSDAVRAKIARVHALVRTAENQSQTQSQTQ